jgi:chromate transporter
VTSLFAVGGGNSVIPEMHRYAVDVQHWLSDRQFADSFALAQLTPGPNLIIVTLIGYHVPITSQADTNRHLAPILLD